jgi:hypothetical protein
MKKGKSIKNKDWKCQAIKVAVHLLLKQGLQRLPELSNGEP